MFIWKLEDMSLFNQKGGIFIGNEKIYNCESSVSREDKIAFVDSMQDGALSYLLELIRKFKEDVNTLSKDSWGYVKTVSLKAWIKRNDTKYSHSIIDCSYNYGKYSILGTGRYIQGTFKGKYDTYDDLVDELFHRQLKQCEKKEERYFLEHDEYSILKKSFREKSEEYHTTFGVHICDWSNGRLTVRNDSGQERDLTKEELKELISKYEQLEAFVEKLTTETHIVY